MDHVNRNRGNLIFCSAALLAVLTFFGWLLTGAGTGADAAEAPFRPVTELTAEPYTFQVKLKDASEAFMLKPNPISIMIRGADDRPVSGAVVDITVYMPDMFCGTSSAKAVEVQPGVYLGEGIPLMAGKSAAEVKVQLDGRTFTIEHLFLSVR